MTIYKSVSFVTPKQQLESFRFEEDNEYEYEIKLNVFARVLEKKTPGKLHFTSFFFTKKVRLFTLKKFKPSPDSNMIKLFPAITTFSLKLA